MKAMGIFAIIMIALGLLFLLPAIGVNLGHYWPGVFCLFGVVSLFRGLAERVNVVLGMLFIGWGAAGIAALEHEALGIKHGFLFFIGIFLIWMPVAWFIARVITPKEKWE